MRVLTIGESMGVVSTEGLFMTGSPATVRFCGSESNVAIGLARLGVDVTWLSRLGADSFGALIASTLTAAGITVIAPIDASAPTGLMTKERRTPLHQRVTYYRAGSPASRLSPADVPDSAFDGVDHLHVSGITPALSESAADATRHMIAEARRRGIRTSLDVNYRSRLWPRSIATHTLLPLLADIDVLFAGDDEATLFVESADAPADVARALRDLGPTEVVLKRGARGALALVDGVVTEASARTVPVVDSVGAGDAFVAGYLAELLAGRPVSERLNTGTLTGAFACMSPGDWEGAPTRAELELLDAEDPVAR